MRNLLALLCSVFLLILCSSCSDDDSTEVVPLEASAQLDVSYGSNDMQKYDVYLPANRSAQSTKVLVLIHGGGWTEGDKEDMNGVVELMQEKHPNHAIVNINYVLADATTPAFPNQFLDVDSVIDQLTQESDELQILPEFGLIGISAGAHLSLMYDAVYDTDDQVKFVADIVGPTDFTDPFYTSNPTFPISLAALVDENAYPAGSNYAEVISPVYQINTASSPAVLFYGNEDPLVPLTNGSSLDQAMTSSQISHGFTIYQGGHGNWSAPDLINVYDQIGDYINAYLAID